MITGAELAELAAALRQERPRPVDFGTASPPDESLTAALAQAVHASRSAILLTDAELDPPGPRILYANPACEALTGYRAAELVGRTPRIMQGPATDRAVLDRLRRDLETTGSFEGIAINYRADGSPFVMSWRIAAVRDADGTPTAYVAIQDDVTREWLDQLHEHQTISALQRALLPASRPRPAGIEIAVHYRPADDRRHVGGDWYDVIEAPDSAVHLVVGDVTGHGAVAAAHMGQFRWALHALLRAGHPPLDAIHRVRELDEEPATYATLAVATVAPTRDNVAVVTAGHPPVLLAHGPGAVTELSTPLPLIGPPFPARDAAVAEAPLRPGDVICLYTDGLVERRDRPVGDGVAALSDHLAARRPSVAAASLDDHLADLVSALTGDRAGDDVAVVLARR